MPRPIKSKQQLTVKNADGGKAPAKNGAVAGMKKNEGRHNDVNSQEISIDLLRERRYLWTARAFAIVSAVALCVNLVLLLAIVHLMPLKRVEPFLLTFQNREEQVVRIRPLSKDMAAEDIISEAMIRQYVLLRNTMVSDVDEMTFRWGPDGPLRWMSSSQVYNQFSKTVKDWLSRIKLEGLTREVRIESVVRNQNTWLVYIVTRDMLPEAEEPAISRWRIRLSVKYFTQEQREVKYINRLKNPLGFAVDRYAIESAND
ncbi:MAG: hypothetical protein IKR09_03685 [Alphaproteobacteria bacterium]|nr:hypothetical protein [Alphaproteobacteria bacterium]